MAKERYSAKCCFYSKITLIVGKKLVKEIFVASDGKGIEILTYQLLNLILIKMYFNKL